MEKTYLSNVQVKRTLSSATSIGGKSLFDMPTPDVIDFRISNGMSTPGWRDRKLSRKPLGTPYSIDVKSTEYGVANAAVTASRRYDTASAWYTDTHFFKGVPEGIADPIHYVDPVRQEELENKAKSAFYDKIRDSRSKINGHAFLGELRQTIDMFRKPLSSAVKLLNRIAEKESILLSRAQRVKAGPRRRDAYMKAIAGTNLEINFGIKPLVSDVKSIAESLADIANRIPPWDRVAVRKQLTLQSGYQYYRAMDGGAWGYWPGCNTTHSQITEHRIQYVGFLGTDAIVGMGSADRLMTNLGFTWENVIPAAYELTPWSWCIDYFSNVGDIINAGTTDTSSLLFYAKTTSARTTVQRYSVFVPPPGVESNLIHFESVSGGTVVSRMYRTTSQRQIDSGLTIPSFQVTRLGDFVGQRIFNLLSVAEQRRANFRF